MNRPESNLAVAPVPPGEQTKILRLSLNPNIIGKPGKSNRLHFATGWCEVEITLDDLVAAVTVEGWAYSAQFKDRYRKAANFLCCDFIAADIDHGWRKLSAKPGAPSS